MAALTEEPSMAKHTEPVPLTTL